MGAEDYVLPSSEAESERLERQVALYGGVEFADVGVQAIPHHALASEPLFETYRRNWLDTVTSLAGILGASFDKGLVERARAELELTGPDEFLLELTVLAHGRKKAQPKNS